MKIIAIANQKGGVAKTTTSINIASCLSELGKKVLLIDTDPQANLTKGLGLNVDDKKTLYECLVDDNIKLNEVIYESVKVNNTKIQVIPSSIKLANAEIELSSTLGRETLLKDLLDATTLNYDYIIIDCNPSLSLLTVNGLCAATDILIPMEPSIFSFEGIEQLVNIIKLVKKKINRGLNILGVLLTRVDARTKIATEFKTELQNIFGDKVFKTIIHQNVKLSEAQMNRLPINLFDRSSKGYQEYMQLAKELIEYE